MYFLCGGLMTLTAFSALLLPESKGRALEDMISQGDNADKNEKDNKEDFDNINGHMSLSTGKVYT